MSKLVNIILDFDQGKEEGFLKVVIDSKGITFHQGNVIVVTKDVATTIQRFLQDACSHIWRMPDLAVPPPYREGVACDEAQPEPRTASEAQAERDS